MDYGASQRRIPAAGSRLVLAGRAGAAAGPRRRPIHRAASAGWPSCRAMSGSTTPTRASGLAAERNRPLTSGDRLATDADARAELRIGSTTLRLGAGTELELLRLDDARLSLQLHHGALALRLRSREVAAQTDVRHRRGPAAAAAQRPLPRRPHRRQHLRGQLERRSCAWAKAPMRSRSSPASGSRSGARASGASCRASPTRCRATTSRPGSPVPTRSDERSVADTAMSRPR